jgi:hypothetical protein
MIIHLKRIKLYCAVVGYTLLRAAFWVLILLAFGWTVAAALRP